MVLCHVGFEVVMKAVFDRFFQFCHFSKRRDLS